MEMKFISWNVNGLRACMEKGFMDFFREADADFFCLQETKMQPHQLELDLPGYRQYWYSADKKGYSGTAVFSKHEPLSVVYGLPQDIHNHEGRAITLEFEKFRLVNIYTPNAQDGLARINYRMQWEDDFRAYVKELDKTKPVIMCGDMNVAHKEIDLKNPGPNRGNAGFSDEERSQISAMLDSGFVDTFRYFYPDKAGEYSWWSYRMRARERNAGWRIDYFLLSERLLPALKSASIHQEIFGSDHCPVGIVMEF